MEALRRRWFARPGDFSYTTCLFHPIVLASTFLLAGRPERISSIQDTGLAAVALCATLLWASISQKLLERPLTQAGRRFHY